MESLQSCGTRDSSRVNQVDSHAGTHSFLNSKLRIVLTALLPILAAPALADESTEQDEITCKEVGEWVKRDQAKGDPGYENTVRMIGTKLNVGHEIILPSEFQCMEKQGFPQVVLGALKPFVPEEEVEEIVRSTIRDRFKTVEDLLEAVGVDEKGIGRKLLEVSFEEGPREKKVNGAGETISIPGAKNGIVTFITPLAREAHEKVEDLRKQAFRKGEFETEEDFQKRVAGLSDQADQIRRQTLAPINTVAFVDVLPVIKLDTYDPSTGCFKSATTGVDVEIPGVPLPAKRQVKQESLDPKKVVYKSELNPLSLQGVELVPKEGSSRKIESKSLKNWTTTNPICMDVEEAKKVRMGGPGLMETVIVVAFTVHDDRTEYKAWGETVWKETLEPVARSTK